MENQLQTRQTGGDPWGREKNKKNLKQSLMLKSDKSKGTSELEEDLRKYKIYH